MEGIKKREPSFLKSEEFKGFLEAIGSISHEWNLWISTFNFLIILFIHLSPDSHIRDGTSVSDVN
ncbi:unnamed protein product [Leptidea sinapis]|uniref:Uncharacterized protein n=1 Tax=Leptidea sinapis TaxID=189913 RepID=A0A5E4QNC3_9NEOP|nr:unnamed protein product [Leptidea sinapis]